MSQNLWSAAVVIGTLRVNSRHRLCLNEVLQFVTYDIFLSGNSLRKIFHTFSPEFLEPFSEGTCGKHTNCLACMLDTLCAWCDLDKTCVIRNVTKGESACVDQNSRKMLITDGSVCPVCSDHVECLTCAQVFDWSFTVPYST